MARLFDQWGDSPAPISFPKLDWAASLGGPCCAMRVDATAKISGEATFAADVILPGTAHVAFARSELARGRLLSVDLEAARRAPGVLLAVAAEEMPPTLFGRGVRDMPLLAREEVRFAGERIAAVVDASRAEADAAAGLVAAEIEPLPPVLDAEAAVSFQSELEWGDRERVQEVLAKATHVHQATYRTQTVHQGYLEPPVTVAAPREGGGFTLWVSNKAPYRLRAQLSDLLQIPAAEIVVEPVAIGGDFGGKGAPMDSAICLLLARRLGRPVRLAVRASDDLIAGNPRHPSRVLVRLGCDGDGRLLAASADILYDGGAYAAFKPRPKADLHGAESAFDGYRIPATWIRSRIARTNSVPRGHMRAPGSIQATFAFESALDELAARAGMAPDELRRRNLLRTGEPCCSGEEAVEERGPEVLAAALAAYQPLPVPPGWIGARGLACYRRESVAGSTSLRLAPAPGGIRAEVAMPETGVGVHTVVRSGLSRLLQVSPESIEIVHVPTSELPHDDGVGASRVTAGLSFALDAAAKAFDAVDRAESVTSVSTPGEIPSVSSWTTQVAQVAVDPETGAYRVLQVLTVADTAEVVNPAAHRLQIEGGAAMAFGQACIEDLQLSEGRVWAAQYGEHRIPSAQDVPVWRTVLVPGGAGLGALAVKPVGELANVAVAAAIANALAAAGARVRSLPMTAERVLAALREGP